MSELIDVAELNDIEPDNKPFRCTAEGTYHGLSAELYHADPCPTPSLSSSMWSRQERRKTLNMVFTSVTRCW